MFDPVTFTASTETKELFNYDREEFCSRLEEEMLDVLKENSNFFDFDLSDNRGSIEAESIFISDLEVNSNGEGIVYYIVWEYYFHGCRDQDGSVDHDGSFRFSYDVASGNVLIPIRELPERDLDDI